MKSLALMALVGAVSAQAFANQKSEVELKVTSERTFAEYIKAYEQPQLFQDNVQAFRARMKLVENAPVGSEVNILTFVYDNGEVVRSLATQMCLAAKRGVKVTLIADSKSGDRAMIADVFDSGINNRVNEEAYQYMANCGVKVVIHNHLSAFNTFLSKAIPKVSYINTDITVGYRLFKIADQFIEILKDEIHSPAFKKEFSERFKQAGLSLEFVDKLKGHFRRLFLAGLILRRGEQPRGFWRAAAAKIIQTFTSDQVIADMMGRPEMAQRVFDSAVADIYEALASLNYNVLNENDLGNLRDSMQRRFNKLPDLVNFYKNIRRFNRLNHRKLFLVESPGKQGCFFLGGRNLGDHYLAWHHDSFIDGDVLYCKQHDRHSADLMADAKASFKEVLEMTNDAVLNSNEDAPVRQVVAMAGFQFKELIVPKGQEDGVGVTDVAQIDEKVLDRESRTLPQPIEWKNSKAIAGVALMEAHNWRIHRVAWQPYAVNDPVRQALVNAINNESQEVYIETAYAEFDATLREAIENALRRGVDVRLVTNGLFVSDGPSKMIRLFMGLWLRDMQIEFAKKTADTGRFSVKFATLEGGHMIHFKGASFKCQMSNIMPYRTSMIGSHNYHPRSGYSDKEHALQWDQPATESCLREHRVEGQGSAALDMADIRDAFYERLQAKFEGNLLREYPTILAEVEHVISLEGKIPAARIERAKLLRGVLYRQSGQLRGGKATEFLLMYLRDSGARDFLGTLL